MKSSPAHNLPNDVPMNKWPLELKANLHEVKSFTITEATPTKALG